MVPTAKVTAAALGGAFTTIALYTLGALTDLEVPAAVAAAVTTLVAFALGFLVKETRPVE